MKNARAVDDIPLMTAHLRLMDDVAYACEKLHELDKYKNTQFKLVRFDFTGFRPENTRGNEDPWVRYPFSFQLHCEAGFAVALLGELCNPSKLTTRNDRPPVPMELSDFRTGLLPRPISTRFMIENKDREAYGIRKDLSSENPNDEAAWLGHRRKNAEKLQKNVGLHLPVEVGVTLNAMKFNKNWEGLAEPPEES